MSPIRGATPTYESEDVLERLRPSVLDDFKAPARIRIETGEQEQFEPELSGITQVPMFVLRVESRCLRPVKPIKMQLYRDGEWFFAENEQLNIIGTGASYQEAMHDLQQHIVHFWDYYHQISDEELTKSTLQLKHLYLGQFQENKTHVE